MAKTNPYQELIVNNAERVDLFNDPNGTMVDSE